MSGRPRRVWAVALLGLLLGAGAARAEVDQDAAWARLSGLIEQAGPVETYRADFVQRKFTPLLREPIVSTGQVRIAGGLSRWDTAPPYASSMLIEGGRLRMYYPQQQTLEVYDLGDRLDRMAASPVPDVAALRENFQIESIEPGEGSSLRVVMLPRGGEVAEAIESVEVVLDTRRAVLSKLAITDLDGETTELTFEQIELNAEIDPAALELEVPAGTKVVHPLEAVDG